MSILLNSFELYGVLAVLSAVRLILRLTKELLDYLDDNLVTVFIWLKDKGFIFSKLLQICKSFMCNSCIKMGFLFKSNHKNIYPFLEMIIDTEWKLC